MPDIRTKFTGWKDKATEGNNRPQAPCSSHHAPTNKVHTNQNHSKLDHTVLHNWSWHALCAASVGFLINCCALESCSFLHCTAGHLQQEPELGQALSILTSACPHQSDTPVTQHVPAARLQCQIDCVTLMLCVGALRETVCVDTCAIKLSTNYRLL